MGEVKNSKIKIPPHTIMYRRKIFFLYFERSTSPPIAAIMTPASNVSVSGVASLSKLHPLLKLPLPIRGVKSIVLLSPYQWIIPPNARHNQNTQHTPPVRQ